MSDNDDLLALVRRGDASDADERRLRELLASSPESRVLYEAGRAFDTEAPVASGDDERIDRMERLVQKRLRRNDARRPSWILRAALAAVLITGGAVGAVELTRRTSNPSTPTPSVKAPAPTTIVPSATHAAIAPPPPAPEPAPEPVPEPAVETPVAPAVHVAIKTAAPVAPTEPAAVTPDAAVVEDAPQEVVTAFTLFAAANRARVAGDIKEAIRISRQLEDQFPETKEAVSTHLSLAMLYLQQHDGVPALDEFQRYRAVAPPASMPEAIWGESQALHELGRVAEERAALDELLAHYPQSAYSAAARKRLAGLP